MDVFPAYTFPYTIGYDWFEDLAQANTRVFIQRYYYLYHPEWNQHYVDKIIMGWRESLGRNRKLFTDYMKVWGIDICPAIYRNNNVTVYCNASLLAPR